MADEGLLKAVCDSFTDALQAGLNAVAPGLGLSVVVALDSPATVVRDAINDVVTVFPFRVELSAIARARPQRPTGTSIPPGPLPLSISYLVTPLPIQRNNEALLLGALMQVLWEKPVIPLGQPGKGLRVDFTNLSVSDMALLWRSLAVPYHPSVVYQVSAM